MSNFFKRAASFIERAHWFSELKGNLLFSTLSLIQIKLSPNKIRQIQFHGLPLCYRAQDMSALKEVLIDKEYKFLKPLLEKEDAPVVLDIGANIGTFAAWVFSVNPNAKILSIEASPSTYKLLEKTVRFSGKENWTVIHAAAWKDNTFVSFSDAYSDSMSQKVHDHGEIKVNALSLKSILKEAEKKFGTSKVDIMKIDIEGAEEAFLSQTKENQGLLSNVAHMTIELHPEYCNTKGTEELLKKSYNSITNQTDRVSGKPLWLCHNV